MSSDADRPDGAVNDTTAIKSRALEMTVACWSGHTHYQFGAFLHQNWGGHRLASYAATADALEKVAGT